MSKAGTNIVFSLETRVRVKQEQKRCLARDYSVSVSGTEATLCLASD